MSTEASPTIEDLFGPPIVVITRGDLLADGSLIDVSELASEAGIRIPCALTVAAWSECVAWDDANGALQDETGRLWDVVWMARNAMARARSASSVDFSLLRVPNRPRCTRATTAWLTVTVGPGDDGEPVATILRLGER